MIGLILTAGGARGAYQAGVLKRIGEIPRLRGKPSPFSIVTGASAGAINGAAIASGSEDIYSSTCLLADLWGQLQVQQVFKSDIFSLSKRSLHWLHDLSLGGFLGTSGAESLLDASPLRALLNQHLKLDGVARNIETGHLYALAISATSYYSGKSFTFIQGREGHPLWQKSRRASLAVKMSVDHVWASCAIPVIFQPVMLQLSIGDYYFGDGGLRLTTPFSPAIRLGSDKVLAIGIRSQKAAEARSQAELLLSPLEVIPKMKRPPLAQIFGITLNSIFLDHLDTDLDHLVRMNEILQSYGDKEIVKSQEPMRIVKPLTLNPSIDLASVAEKFSEKMPKMVRYLLEGLGHSKAQSADLMSYLLFDKSYTQTLIDIGYQDAKEHLAEIEEFFWGEAE